MKKKDIGISKIILKLGDVEVELSVEDARALQDTLNILFKKEVEHVPYTPYVKPYTVPYKPWWQDNTYTWGTGAGTTVCDTFPEIVKVSMTNMSSVKSVA